MSSLTQFSNIISAVRQGFNREPWYLIFAITGRCNQRCAMCFYWKNVKGDHDNELTLKEISLIASQFKNLYQLTLSGGEPLLRNDCLDIAMIFADGTPVRRITLTSNGMLPQKIEAFVRDFCSQFPKVSLSVNLSIDGTMETHNRIRGVKGAFEKFLESFDLLKDLKKEFKNLTMATATTVSTLNQDEILDLLDFIETRLNIVNHGLMFARGDIHDAALSNVSLERFSIMLTAIQKKIEKRAGIYFNSINKAYQERRICSLKRKRMLDPCLAGRKLLILDEKGNLAPCELLEPLRFKNALNLPFGDDFMFGNLREFDYDLNGLLSTPKVKKIIKFIEEKGCWCSFECAMINNFVLNPYNYIRIIKNLSKKLLSKEEI